MSTYFKSTKQTYLKQHSSKPNVSAALHVTMGPFLAEKAIYSPKNLDVGKIASAEYCTGAGLLGAKPLLSAV